MTQLGEEKKGIFVINSWLNALFCPKGCKNSLQIFDCPHSPLVYFFFSFLNRRISTDVIQVLILLKNTRHCSLLQSGLYHNSVFFFSFFLYLFSLPHVTASVFPRSFLFFFFFLESTSQRGVIPFYPSVIYDPFNKLGPSRDDQSPRALRSLHVNLLEYFKPRWGSGDLMGSRVQEKSRGSGPTCEDIRLI